MVTSTDNIKITHIMKDGSVLHSDEELKAYVQRVGLPKETMRLIYEFMQDGAARRMERERQAAG
jgi:hypothetical protein